LSPTPAKSNDAGNVSAPLPLSSAARALRDKLRYRTADVAVVGLGYVGLPLAVMLGRAGFRVHGIDADPERASLANAGTSYIGDVAGSDLADLVVLGGRHLRRGVARRRHPGLRADAAQENPRA